MNTLFKAIVASVFALGAVSAFGADMTNEERAALRERAAALQAQRAQNPGEARSDVDFARDRGEVRLTEKRGEVKKAKKTRKAGKKTKRTAKPTVQKAKAEATQNRGAR
jgi:hypothetical protein